MLPSEYAQLDEKEKAIIFGFIEKKLEDDEKIKKELERQAKKR